ncbi:unnamed protein product [Didymodactylos carnosus]|uniref:Uncharacterized protein n=1 Tax=Didymodactylos carnosus TaxID=1234261 RepID=A0A815XAL2_9BILA|nr:unnamed protein product [Didymodactylos carnosus]CAF4416254.1 unnamed protein product [Didymodactylos carnosus]
MIAAITIIFTAYHAGYKNERTYYINVLLILGIVGFIFLISIEECSNFKYIASILACMGTCTILPLILSWATANIGGQRKRAVASALIIVLIMVLLLKFLLKREKKRRELLDGRRLAAEDTEYASTDKHRSFSYIL